MRSASGTSCRPATHDSPVCATGTSLSRRSLSPTTFSASDGSGRWSGGRIPAMSSQAGPLPVVTEVPDRAMVVFAHPDDAEIGSGGVVARWIAAGCDVSYVLCTNGDAGTAARSMTPVQLAAKRAEEQRAAAD